VRVTQERRDRTSNVYCVLCTRLVTEVTKLSKLYECIQLG